MSTTTEHIVQQLCRLAAQLADEIENEPSSSAEVQVRLTVTIVELPHRQHDPVTAVEHTRSTRWFDGEWQETVATRSEKWA